VIEGSFEDEGKSTSKSKSHESAEDEAEPDGPLSTLVPYFFTNQPNEMHLSSVVGIMNINRLLRTSGFLYKKKKKRQLLDFLSSVFKRLLPQSTPLCSLNLTLMSSLTGNRTSTMNISFKGIVQVCYAQRISRVSLSNIR